MIKIDGDGKWKNNIRMKNANKDYDGAKKDLRMIKAKYYDELQIKDKLFVDYCLAHHHYREKSSDMANYYLKEMSVIFSDIYNIRDFKQEYMNYLWLNVSVNEKTLDIKQKIEIINKVYDYYISIDMKDIAMSALGTLSVYENDESKAIKALKTLLSRGTCEVSFIETVLKDCEKINHSLYIKGLALLNNYSEQKKIN